MPGKNPRLAKLSGNSALTSFGHGAAKVLNIKLDYRNEQGIDPVTRGESVFSVTSADSYVEDEPTVYEWLDEHVIPSRQDVVDYVRSLFPFTKWILRYNVQWLIGDLVAGITIGAVVVPQSMAYASLAEVPPQYGLYSAFMGCLIYWIFATSKDINIGPVAVMSTITGNIVTSAKTELPNVSGPTVASALAVIAGSIIFFMGLVRIGWIVEFISLAAICAFITGSAFNIAMGQIPNLMGISSDYVNSHASTYQVVINVLKNLDHVTLAPALGLTALLLLYILKYGFRFAARKYPQHQRLFFFAGTLRVVFVVLLYTLISWASQKDIDDAFDNGKWPILGPVPRGFQRTATPFITIRIIRFFASQLPAVVIVLLIEHISISKSFGRINGYVINPSQELLAIGITNIFGPFFGAYPATGSFSRTAIKSKAGVRTPLAGIYTAIVVLLALYALPAVFYWIPTSALAAVIIHAVLDLITPANTVYQFWRISPLEVLIFLAGVFVTVFSTIENGVYTTICTSAGLLLYRVVMARGRFLGKVSVHSVVGDHILDTEKSGVRSATKPSSSSSSTDEAFRNVYLPLDHRDGSNPLLEIERPYPGIFIYRFSEGFNYPNASHYLDHLVQVIFKETRRTTTDSFARPGDRPWNNPGPKKGQEHLWVDKHLPTLKAVILDFSSVNNIDITSAQNLIDVRNQLDRYTTPDVVEWHIACINNRWTKRALVSAGFGYPPPATVDGDFHRWKPIYSVAEMGHDSAAAWSEQRDNERLRSFDIEHGHLPASNAPASSKAVVVHGLNRPFFHADLTSALQSAIASYERRRVEAGATKSEVAAEKVYEVVAESQRSGDASANESG